MRLPYNRGGIRFYLMLLGLLAGHATPLWVALGIPLLLTGVALHFWAKGCLRQNVEVATAGPYRFVRHPFYLGNAFIDFGISVMSGWWLLLLVFPFWWLAVYIPPMRREEATMTSLFSDTYIAYRDRVPSLIPYRHPLPKQAKGFSWQKPNILKTEVPRGFRFLSYPLMFVISFRLHSHGLALLLSPTLVDVFTVVMCFVLYSMGLEFRQHFKHQQPILPSWAMRGNIRTGFLLGIFAIGLYATSFEVENEWAIWPPGLLLLGLSAILRKVRPQVPIIAEGLLAIGYAVMCELMWLAVLLFPIYLGISLDTRLAKTPTPRTREPLEWGLGLVPKGASAFYVLLIGALVVATAKELWL